MHTPSSTRAAAHAGEALTTRQTPSPRSLMTCPECGKNGVNQRLAQEDHWACRYCTFSAFCGGADTIDLEARIALRARNMTHPHAPRTRFRATFTAQAWVGDHAVDVDPQGETSWFVSREYEPAAARIIAAAPLEDVVGNGVLDRDDVLATDPASPSWTRSWNGPFSIHVTGQECYDLDDD